MNKRPPLRDNPNSVLVARGVTFEPKDLDEAKKLGIDIPNLFRAALKEEIKRRTPYVPPSATGVLLSGSLIDNCTNVRTQSGKT